MHVDIHVTKEDLWSCFCRYLWRHQLVRPLLTVLFLMIASFVAVLVWGVFSGKVPVAKLAVCSSIVFVTVCVLYFLPKFTLLHFLSEQGAALGDHTVSISAEGLREVTPVAEISFEWSAVKDVFETDTLIAVILDGHMMMPIPKRAFQNTGAVHDFMAKLRSFVDGSGKGPNVFRSA